jgi:hypothetical protein
MRGANPLRADPLRIPPEKCKDVYLDLLADALIEMALKERREAQMAPPSEESPPTDSPCGQEESKDP